MSERLRAELSIASGALGRHASNAHVTWARREGLLLKLRDRDGRVGLGEASPLPGYSPDSLAACRAALEPLVYEGPRALESVEGAATGAALGLELAARLEAHGPLPPAARFALETALLDLAAQQRGQPLHALLAELHGRRAEAPGTEAVPLCALIDETELAAAIRAAEGAIVRGVRTLKVKIGRPGAFEIEREIALTLRRVLPGDVALRFDANGALAFRDLAGRLAELRQAAPELIEEPCAARLPEAAALVHAQELPPLAADESLQAPGGFEAAAPWIRSGAIRAVVLKPTALGGLSACLALSERAAALGGRTIVTHCFEGPVALAAAAALALALPPERRLACGLDRHQGLCAWQKRALPFLAGDRVVPLDSPGLGLGPAEDVS